MIKARSVEFSVVAFAGAAALATFACTRAPEPAPGPEPDEKAAPLTFEYSVLILDAQVDYADSGAFPELLRLYHLFGDPALRVTSAP